MAAARIARVLIDSPLPQLDRLFDYLVPERCAADIAVGVRVRVPLRSAGRITDGFVVELVDSADFSGTLSELESVLSPIPVLSPDVWVLARRVADRAAGSAADIIRLAVPARQVRVEKAYLAAGPAETSAPEAVVAPGIRGYAAGVLESAIAAAERVAVDAVPRVVAVGDSWVGAWALTLAQCAAATVAAGSSAILAVPDYRDQDQLETALAAILAPESFVRLDARQSKPDRYRSFLRCLSETPLVIIGNRSVVYAPAQKLGLIAIWDDGDPLHGEPLSPYVHARDAALLRQEQQHCALILMGHSRSTEVERLVELGWLNSISPVPALRPHVIPTAMQPSDEQFAARARIPSSAWQQARSALAHGPVLVQVARPGYSPRLACAECAHIARCARCEGPLGQKTPRGIPACAWCGALAAEWRCSHCEGTRIRSVGVAGASRTAEDLGRAFPGARIVIADGEHQVQHIDSRPALVIATRGAEPIAAGGYRAILLLDGELMLARESLRVAEDCLRWWSNAIALAAPGAPAIIVGVGGALASALLSWHQPRFIAAELADRKQLRFPPAVRVATVTGTTDAVAKAIAAVTTSSAIAPIDILGPVDVGPSSVRSIIRFDYGKGPEIAAALRAEVIQAASSRRRRPGSARAGGTAPLRVRFDDSEPFLEQ